MVLLGLLFRREASSEGAVKDAVAIVLLDTMIDLAASLQSHLDGTPCDRCSMIMPGTHDNHSEFAI